MINGGNEGSMFAHNISVKSAESRVTLTCNGAVVAQTARALKLHEPPLLPVYYIPRDDVHMHLLEPSRHKSICPFKGEAGYFHLNIGGERYENAAWSYEAPKEEVADIKDFIAFYDSVVEISED